MPDLADLFPGYDSKWINTSSGRIFARVGGNGPPLMLLHGFSSTHVMWHKVAPRLADKFTLIIADLPGYGWSDMPAAAGSPIASRSTIPAGCRGSPCWIYSRPMITGKRSTGSTL